MTSEVALSKRRGFQFRELEANKIGILLVKAPIELTSPVIAQVFGGHLKLNIWGRQYHPSDCWMILIYQYQGHPWSIVFPINVCAQTKVSQVSKSLKTRCIYLQHEDTSASYAYQLFDRGKCIEEFDWGTDYTEEVFDISPQELPQYVEEMEAQGTPIADSWNPNKWDIYITSGSHVGYKFRTEQSTVRVTEDDLRKPKVFLDFLLRRQDAWLPDCEHIPWGEIVKAENANSEDFVRVDGLARTTKIERQT
ncbi:MAG: hypothetical protein JGK21_24775 [Microcoleus sp. PH2017_22_RUC_O_B]|uniref:hypothetical protein n=1 Tax=unclassified Microcoleus TaxID=2642155 RepID=UPI001D4F4CB2|nr:MULTISPECIES: hypothetical protein [unclassified Microcoleus]MCC3531206.1 hypothetical protein [Microcoleus sp. PH2017_21_RUC_O_A]MCC3543505.1 hypothetical protein [Microcoleus sp. PH2017_22_RUC_O_B]